MMRTDHGSEVAAGYARIRPVLMTATAMMLCMPPMSLPVDYESRLIEAENEGGN
jgi:multidrug efflux pump subunit AcrB